MPLNLKSFTQLNNFAKRDCGFAAFNRVRFLFLSQKIVQITMVNKTAPIQTEETKSSTPNHLESPNPAPIATAHTGQTACAFTVPATTIPKKAEITDAQSAYLLIKNLKLKIKNSLLYSCCIFEKINHLILP